MTVVESLLGLYISFQNVSVLCPANGCPWPSPYLSHSLPALFLELVLLALGLLGLWGAFIAFPAGTVASAVFALLMGYTAWTDSSYGYLADESMMALVGLVAAGVAVAVNAWAWRTRTGISEQANPMNLPVFG